jgi:hypothetical protein
MWRGPLRVLLAGVGALAVGCGSPQPPAFHPAGANPVGSGGSGSSQLGQTSSQKVTWPPFGRNVRVIMPPWLPSDPSEVPAVITAKNFLLAILYAEYRGNQDDRWKTYAASSVTGALSSELAKPDVATQSFTGTIRFSQMSAFSDPVVPGAVDVAECFKDADSANVGLHSGKVIPDRTPADQHYYRNTDAIAKDANGRWHVVTIYPVIYYPQARECKP